MQLAQITENNATNRNDTIRSYTHAKTFQNDLQNRHSFLYAARHLYFKRIMPKIKNTRDK